MRGAVMRCFIGILFGVGVVAGCAASVQVSEREYIRPILSDLSLRTLDVVVVVSGPAVEAEETLQVDAFPPPEPADVMTSKVEHTPTRQALVEALRERLQMAGFQIRLIHVGGLNRPADTSGKTAPGAARTTTLPLATTSTAMTQSKTGTRAVAASELPRDDFLNDGVTLKDVLTTSHADGVLVVRAVPVDSFYVHVGSKARVSVSPEGGRVPTVERKPVQYRGRLLVGQAFLFDRKTSLRLWTRQIPDFPENGRLAAKDPFLAYGYVAKGSEDLVEDPDRASRAVVAFTQRILEDFPLPKDGRPEARAELDAVDVDVERSRQLFLDESRFGLELGFGWVFEQVGTDLSMDQQSLPELGTGALAPVGVVALEPRLSYVAPGGFTVAAAIPFGLGPNAFSRSYHRDNPSPDLSDPNDRSTTLTVGNTRTYGGELTAGYLFVLSPSLILVPHVGAFVEVWSLDASPGAVLPDRSHFRVGGTTEISLLFPFSDGQFFGRTAGGLRLGVDTAGPVAVGFNLSAGLGLFL